MTTFGKRFKDLREKRNLTQEELVNMFNAKYFTSFNKSTISQYENDKRKPEINVLENWADFFDVTIDYLLARTDNPKITFKDEKSIQNDLKKIMEDFKSGQDGPAFYNGEELDEDELYLIEQAMEIALKTAKVKNKEKYTPNKYKK